MLGTVIVKDPDALVIGPGDGDGPWQVRPRYIRRHRQGPGVQTTVVLPYVLAGYTSELLGFGIEPLAHADPIEDHDRQRRGGVLDLGAVRLVSWPHQVDVAELWGPGDKGAWGLAEPTVGDDGRIWFPTLPKELLLGFTHGPALAIVIQTGHRSDAYAVDVSLRLYSEANLAETMAAWRGRDRTQN